jgi:hypothetical protein
MARNAEEREGAAKEASPAAEVNGRPWFFEKGLSLAGRRLSLQAGTMLRCFPGRGKKLRRCVLARRSSRWGRFAPAGDELNESTEETPTEAAMAVGSAMTGSGTMQATGGWWSRG